MRYTEIDGAMFKVSRLFFGCECWTSAVCEIEDKSNELVRPIFV